MATSSSSAQRDGKKVVWPSSLKTVLKIHLKCIQSDRKMPLIEESPHNSVHSVLTKAAEAMPSLCPSFFTLHSFPKQTLSTLVDFILDLFEQCCLCNLLTLEERRTFQFIVLGKQTATGRQQKKRRVEEVSHTPLHQRLVYASVLTVEYLLRLIAAMPVLVHHYQVLCTGSNASRPADQSSALHNVSDGCEPLWLFVNGILKYLELNPTTMTPLSNYASFIDE